MHRMQYIKKRSNASRVLHIHFYKKFGRISCHTSPAGLVVAANVVFNNVVHRHNSLFFVQNWFIEKALDRGGTHARNAIY